MGRLVIFVGPVGSGKTTQMEFLAKRLRSENLRVSMGCVKPFFKLTQIFEFLCNKLKIEATTVKYVLKIIVSLELFLNTFILLPLMLFKIEFERLFCPIVLVEEHALGSIIDYIHLKRLYNIDSRYIMVLVKFLSPFLSKADIIISLTSDVSTLKYRWKIRGSQPENLTYINLQYKIFQLSNHMNGVFQVSASKSIDEVGQQIYDTISTWRQSGK
ncbi:MAG: hypothetical protein ABR909_05705 [Candidatus Bathyarchaeia archaeon]|jgi:energy-coupling factor transporter ATP-binding protein EcfA2